MRFLAKYKGGVVIYALYFTLGVGFICTFTITKAYNNKRTVILCDDYDLARRSVSSALNYCLIGENVMFNKKNTRVFHQNKKVTFIKRQWGFLDQIIAKAQAKYAPFVLGGFYGNTLIKDRSICLYLADNNSVLSVTGSTLLKGDVYLPKKGITRAFVEGKSFEREKTVEGKIYTSDNTTPKLNTNHIAVIKKYLNGMFNVKNDSVLTFEYKDSIFNSFLNKTTVYKGNNLYLKKGNYSGNILFYSPNKITIDSSCRLENVLVFAPKIIIKAGTRGSFQAFAIDSLIVEKDVTLTYPSTVGIINNRKNSFLSLDSNVVIEGNVVHASIGGISNTLIHKDATVRGIVYDKNRLTLKGKVFGKVIANKFYLETSSSRYTNHLIDATIDISEVPKFMVCMLEDNKREKKLMKRL